MAWLDILYRYHAVGQGLFSSGALYFHPGDFDFRWIYDCGTTSSQTLIDREIRRIAAINPTARPDHIELVTISHFDRDHISGLARLLGRHSIDTLLLPYMPLWSRLLLAFRQGVDSREEAFRLFVDPVGYIRGLDGGGRIGRIVMVGPGNGEGASPPPDEGSPEGPREGAPRLSIDKIELDADTAAELLLDRNESQGGTEVAMLRPGGALRIESIWEFVPYNDAESEPADIDAFRDEIARSRDDLLKIADEGRGVGDPVQAEKDIQAAIERLKKIYDRTIGADAKHRNIISLFLYSGPLGKRPGAWFRRYSPRAWWYGRRPSHQPAQLFCGDGYLDDEARLAAMERHFGPVRMDRMGILQVMHHGARANWHAGVATRLAPEISVFSSDPEHKGFGHPHAEVLRDFWPYGAVQVDSESDFSVLSQVA